MRKYYSIKMFGVLIFSLIMIGCDETSSPQPIKYTMLGNLIGQWHSDYSGGIIFYEDGTFVDSIKTWYSNSISQKAEYVVQGNYMLNDSILTFSNVKMLYCMYSDDPLHRGILSYYKPAIVSFAGGDLQLRKTMKVEKQNSSTTDFSGEWKTTIYGIEYQRDNTPQYVCGEVNFTLNFNDSTAICTISENRLYNSMFENKTDEHDYSFENGWLEIINFGSYFVEWINGKAYWTSNTVSYKRVAQN